jgi:putative hydrolase of the HAD superfamily
VGRFRALLVDYGGVLTTPIGVSFARFCVETGVSPERFKAVLAGAYADHSLIGSPGVSGGDEPDGLPAAWHTGDLVADAETGRITQEEFERRLAAALSDGLAEPLEPVDLGLRLFASLQPDHAMRSAVAAAHARGFRTVMVSNTWGAIRSEQVQLIDELFDDVVRSDEVGVRKPDPEIYLLAAARAAAAPEACVFVDDIPVNVEGARAVGMAGVLHRDAAITIPRLQDLLGVGLTLP